MSNLRVPDWSPDDVADWIKGLEDCFRPYIQTFLNNDIDGRHLMTISSDDLNHLNIWRIGHQELFMEAVEQLRQSYYHLDVENLQWLALKLSCKARGIFGELSKPPPSSYPLHQNFYHYHNPHHQNTGIDELALTRNQDKVATSTLSAVADLISSVKTLVTWIDRPPFSGEKKFKDKRKTLLQICVELATNAQRDKFAEKPNNVIRNICLEIYAMCDELIKEKKEPLVLQPSSLESVSIKKKPNEELEVNISSLSWGVHVIASMKYQGPTSACGRVEIGDEIVQVNGQTVLGWMLKKLVLAMAENPTEVVLTLKKRPQHSNSFGRPNNLFPNNFLLMTKKASPKTARPKSAIKVNTDNILIDPRGSSIPKQEGSLHNPSITLTPAVPTHHRHTVPTPIPPTVICEPETPIEDEDDDSAFLSEADSRSLGSDVYLSIPKLHVALQRRATVTGASPTSTRPPVSIDQLWHNAKRDQIARSYSHDVSRNESAKEKLQLKFDFKERWCGNYEKEPKSTVVTFREPRKEKAVAFSEVPVSEANKLSKANVNSNQKADNNEAQQHTSYQVIIVGGVPHRQQSFGKHVKDTSTLPVLRSKHKNRSNNSKRRVSCKDLGEGECQGWLYQRKENKGVFLNSHKWVKQWCVLKKGCLYVYDDEEAMRARCFICLKGFNVSPAPESYKSKRFAFQIYRSGVSFQFCSESQSDLSKWMNKLGLAAIDYEASSNNNNNHHQHYHSSKKSSKGGEDYSETEDEEDDDVLAPSSTDEQTVVNQVETASTSSLSSSSSYQSAADSLEPPSSLNIQALQPKKIVKAKSLDWKNFPIHGDTYHSLPSSPIVEVAKMSLAFEMNLDSTPPSPQKKEPESLPPISPSSSQRFVSPKLVRKTSSIRGLRTYERGKDKKEWIAGDYSATLPASTPSYKSSVAMERRIYGSPKLARVVNKPVPQFRKEDLIGHRLRDMELWKPFRISSIPSRQDDSEGSEKSSKVEENHGELSCPLTPKPVCKPAMGISMIGKNRRGSENRSSANQTIMATISQATQTDIGVKSDDPLARMVLHLHEADLHIDGTCKFLRRTNSAFSPHPDRRFSQILLHLRALHRTLVAKEMDVSVIDKLLDQKKITNDKLKKWMDENRHILQ